MRLYPLLEVAMNTGDIVVNKESEYGIKFCSEIQFFVWCQITKNHEFCKSKKDVTGYDRVVMTPKMMNHKSDDWNMISHRTHEQYDIGSSTCGTNGYNSVIQYRIKVDGKGFIQCEYLDVHEKRFDKAV